MEAILHAFGIDWRLIVIQIFNFGILAGVLWYFLYNPVLKILAERESKVKKGIHDAEEAAKLLASADVDKNALLKKAHDEAREIVTRGTQHAEEKSAQLISETNDRIARKISESETEVLAMKERAQKESEAEVAKLAMLATEKILGQKLSK